MTQTRQQSQIVTCTLVSGPLEMKPIPEYELFFARRGLAKLKSRLGRDGLRRLLEPDLDAGDSATERWLAESNGKWRPALTELRIKGLRAAEFSSYFDSIRADEPKLLEAHPQHYVIARTDDGFEVIENHGPILDHFYTHFTPVEEAIEPVLADHPIRMVGHTTTQSGKVRGHTLHQMREVEGGFEARLAIYFPVAAPEEVVEGHRQHLAVEFANWIAAAAAKLGRAGTVTTTLVSGPVEMKTIAEYELMAARSALATIKSKLGREGLRDLLKPDIEAADADVERWVAESDGKWTPGITELRISGLHVADFAAYFDSIRADEPRLLEAEPEHFVIAKTEDGFDVVENHGPYIPQCWVHFRPVEEAIDEVLADHPFRMVGHVTTPSGTISEHVLHQMRDTEDGFEARLGVYFPAAAPESVVEGHRQHLAVEFSGWIAGAAKRMGRTAVVR